MRRPFDLEDAELVFDEDNEILTPVLFEGINAGVICFQDIYNQPINPNAIPCTIWKV